MKHLVLELLLEITWGVYRGYVTKSEDFSMQKQAFVAIKIVYIACQLYYKNVILEGDSIQTIQKVNNSANDLLHVV